MAKCDDREPKNSPVRHRVMRHLKHLLVPGLMGLGACKTSGGDVVCDPLPPPPPPTDTAPPGEGYAEPPPGEVLVPDQDAGVEQRPDAETPPPPVVCDPLPPPPRNK